MVNIKHREHFDVYIGRPMPGHRSIGWGNPFKAGDDRQSAIGRYREFVQSNPRLMARLPELRGKTLGCWCAPQGGLEGDLNGTVCHGQILAALADAYGEAYGDHDHDSGDGGD